MPPKDLQTRLLRGLVDTFLATGKGLTRRQLVIQFRDKGLPDLLAKLTQNGTLRQDDSNSGQEYKPSILAFALSGNQKAVQGARKNFVLIGEILAQHYFDAPERVGLPLNE